MSMGVFELVSKYGCAEVKFKVSNSVFGKSWCFEFDEKDAVMLASLKA
jgi:hypothetical protein